VVVLGSDVRAGTFKFHIWIGIGVDDIREEGQELEECQMVNKMSNRNNSQCVRRDRGGCLAVSGVSSWDFSRIALASWRPPLPLSFQRPLP